MSRSRPLAKTLAFAAVLMIAADCQAQCRPHGWQCGCYGNYWRWFRYSHAWSYSPIYFPKRPAFNPIRQAPDDIHPASLTQLQWLVNMQRAVELEDAQRFDRILREQEWEARQKIDRYGEESRKMRRVASGNRTSIRTLQAGFRLAKQYSDRGGVYEALQAPVKPIPGSAFANPRVTFSVLEPGGSLERLPRFLYEDRACRKAHAEMAQSWEPVHEAIAEGRLPSYDDEAALSDAAQRFEKAARYLINRSENSFEKCSAKKYVRSTTGLAKFASDEKMASELAVFASAKGAAFAGGTRRDLINHMERHRLTLHTDSPVQRHLQAVSHAVDEHLQAQIAQQTEWLEVLKNQHHWADWIGPWRGCGGQRDGGVEPSMASPAVH